MAEKYIVNMPLKTTPDDTDLMIIEDAQDTKRMTWANVIKPIKDLIGNLASLTTTHKTSVVGAINEVDNTVAAHLADIVQTTQVNSSTKYPSAAVTYGIGQKLDRFQIQLAVADIGLISQSSTTAQLISAMPQGSIISFSHINEHAVKLTDLPQNYGQVFLVKSAYTLGFFSTTGGYMYRWNLSTNAWVSM